MVCRKVRLNELELVNAVHALGFFRGVHKAAERSLELLAARTVSHAAQAWAVPVDLASLGVEGGFLASFVFKFLGRLQSGF